jgi:hypothetical protein
MRSARSPCAFSIAAAIAGQTLGFSIRLACTGELVAGLSSRRPECTWRRCERQRCPWRPPSRPGGLRVIVGLGPASRAPAGRSCRFRISSSPPGP